ncbi:AraC-like DNA-binding protein [Variovorax sp. OAS795]|uniref:AraC family transcriptional regulator n=1 Tax=Variovorax sp. OAS795 TaxID=3034231 RepID=UPI0033992362
MPCAPWSLRSTHPAYARLLISLMESKGFRAAHLFAGEEALAAKVSSSSELLSYSEIRTLIERALRLTGNPALGLELGGLEASNTYGWLGQALMCSSNVRHALLVLHRFGKLRTGSFHFSFESTEACGVLSVSELHPLGSAGVFLFESAAMSLVNLLRELTFKPLLGLWVSFPFPKPAWESRYRSLGVDEVFFSSRELQIGIPHPLLDTACLMANEAAFARAERACEEAMVQRSQGMLTRQIKVMLRSWPGRYPTLEEVAAARMVSARTLIRKLKCEGTTYQELLDDARKSMSIWLLQNTPDSIDSVAARMGFSNPSNFGRSFKRWFGFTPGGVRRNTPPLGLPPMDSPLYSETGLVRD